MTRPRISGSAAICRPELMPAANVTEQTPSSPSASISSGSDGAAAAIIEVTPNPIAAAVISSRLTFLRVPTVRAPVIEPTPIATISSE